MKRGPQAILQTAAPSGVQTPQRPHDSFMQQLSPNGNLAQHDVSHGSAWPWQPQTMMTHGNLTSVPAGQSAHQQQQASAFQQHGHLQHSFAVSNGHNQLRRGAVPHCPGAFANAPAPPPGFALVPIAPDGTLHYPGAITNPQEGGISFSLGPGQTTSGQCMYGWTDIQQTTGQPVQSARAYWHQQQQQQQQQQQRQQRQQQRQQRQMSHPQLASQQTRKRKLPDMAVPASSTASRCLGTQSHPQLPVSVGGCAADVARARDQRPSLGQDFSSLCNRDAVDRLPESNADAAAQLRNRLKATAATPSATAGGSGLQAVSRAVPRKPHLGAANPQHAAKVKLESQMGEEVASPGSMQTADPAEVQISNEDSDSHASHGPSVAFASEDPESDSYKGPHGPDCIRAGDRTQVSMTQLHLNQEQLLTLSC